MRRPRLLRRTHAVVGRQQRLGQPPARPRLLVDVPEAERLDGGPPQLRRPARRAAARPRPPPARSRPRPRRPSRRPARGTRPRRTGPARRAAPPAPVRRSASAVSPTTRAAAAASPSAPSAVATSRRTARWSSSHSSASRRDVVVASSTAVSASPDQAARSISAAAVTMESSTCAFSRGSSPRAQASRSRVAGSPRPTCTSRPPARTCAAISGTRASTSASARLSSQSPSR